MNKFLHTLRNYKTKKWWND